MLKTLVGPPRRPCSVLKFSIVEPRHHRQTLDAPSNTAESEGGECGCEIGPLPLGFIVAPHKYWPTVSDANQMPYSPVLRYGLLQVNIYTQLQLLIICRPYPRHMRKIWINATFTNAAKLTSSQFIRWMTSTNNIYIDPSVNWTQNSLTLLYT